MFSHCTVVQLHQHPQPWGGRGVSAPHFSPHSPLSPTPFLTPQPPPKSPSPHPPCPTPEPPPTPKTPQFPPTPHLSHTPLFPTAPQNCSQPPQFPILTHPSPPNHLHSPPAPLSYSPPSPISPPLPLNPKIPLPPWISSPWNPSPTTPFCPPPPPQHPPRSFSTFRTPPNSSSLPSCGGQSSRVGSAVLWWGRGPSSSPPANDAT